MSGEFLGIDWKTDPETQDWVLDGIGEPGTVSGPLSLAQGLRHRIAYDAEVLGFLHRDLPRGEVADLLNLVQIVAERDPRVVAGSAKAGLRSADPLAGLEINLSVRPINSDRPENLVVRVGG